MYMVHKLTLWYTNSLGRSSTLLCHYQARGGCHNVYDSDSYERNQNRVWELRQQTGWTQEIGQESYEHHHHCLCHCLANASHQWSHHFQDPVSVSNLLQIIVTCMHGIQPTNLISKFAINQTKFCCSLTSTFPSFLTEISCGWHLNTTSLMAVLRISPRFPWFRIYSRKGINMINIVKIDPNKITTISLAGKI